MKTFIILYIYSAMAMTGPPERHAIKMDWVANGQYVSMAHCKTAARNLYGNDADGKTRCIDSGIQIQEGK